MENFKENSAPSNCVEKSKPETQKNCDKPPSKVATEGVSFSGPKIPEINRFRRLVETGKINEVKELVEQNPRYLVTSVDKPTILHEGCRYNALHICSKANQLEMMKYIISSLDSVLNHLYMNEEVPAIKHQHLKDYYFNAREKGFFETPLHIASKFGHEGIVKYLLSQKNVDKTLLNNYGQTAEDVACSRSSNKENKEKICKLFDDWYYVAILRSEDNSTPPQLVKPFCPNKFHPTSSNKTNYYHLKQHEDEIKTTPKKTSSFTNILTPTPPSHRQAKHPSSSKTALIFRTPNNKPLLRVINSNISFSTSHIRTKKADLNHITSTQEDYSEWEKVLSPLNNKQTDVPRKVYALAGPMCEDEAHKFYKKVKFGNRDVLSSVKKLDVNKGLERACRQVAKEMSIEWREYWDFLGCFADMETKEGLQRLEEYLQQNLSLNQVLDQSIQQSADVTNDPINTSLELVDSLPIYDDHDDGGPSERFPNLEDEFEDNFILGRGLDNISSYNEMLGERCYNDGVKELDKVLLMEEMQNVLKNNTLENLCDVFSQLKLRSPNTNLNETLHQNTSNNSTNNSSNFTKKLDISTEALEDFIKYNNSNEDNDEDDDYYTAAGSEAGDFEDAHEWEDEDKTLFIFGDMPTQTDLDMHRALEQSDLESFPRIGAWVSKVSQQLPVNNLPSLSGLHKKLTHASAPCKSTHHHPHSSLNDIKTKLFDN